MQLTTSVFNLDVNIWDYEQFEDLTPTGRWRITDHSGKKVMYIEVQYHVYEITFFRKRKINLGVRTTWLSESELSYTIEGDIQSCS